MVKKVSPAKIMATFVLIFFAVFYFFVDHRSLRVGGVGGGSSTCQPVSQQKKGLGYTEECTLQFKQYIPSQLELKWMENVVAWQDTPKSFCVAQEQFKAEIDVWLRVIQKLSYTPNGTLPETDPDYKASEEIFSKFIYKKTCGSNPETLEVKWIEPLALSLRDPRHNWDCGGRQYEYSRAYILLDSITGRTGGQTNLLLDLGASTFSQGLGGASQQYFYEKYKARGIKFNRILLWEGTTVSDPQLTNEVPADWYPYYQYYNVLAPCGKTDLKNPLNMLKVLVTPEDFVTFKLDIDTAPVEMAFIKQIIEEPEVHNLLDEFFFEHHVNFHHMNTYWGNSIDRNLHLSDTYKLLTHLRKLGIRAHGWP
eukprot:TRINITY_DN5853_c0_g4_i2.p1 TRINITY_DN5853_c0_g4~~TRINITY_DN5853_c0_g4_i2.p1  ORF type:complete len:366 (-),score=81.39 TRINITY_DN5853_c0_g4_i2:80-1177(-)